MRAMQNGPTNALQRMILLINDSRVSEAGEWFILSVNKISKGKLAERGEKIRKIY